LTAPALASSRNGHDFSERYPAVADAVERLRCRSCVIDGEVVITDEAGRAVFDPLQQGPRVRPEAFLFAFDMIELDGDDMRQMPLLTRKSRLLKLPLTLRESGQRTGNDNSNGATARMIIPSRRW